MNKDKLVNNGNSESFDGSSRSIESTEEDSFTESSQSEESIGDNINDDLKGEILIDKYVLINRIGRGSFAVVWLSLNLQNGKYYAIKLQNHEDYDSGMEEVNHLKKFAKSNCQHINYLIEYFEYKVEEGVHICMVFDLLAGSLYDIIKCGRYSKGLPLNIVKKITLQLLEAMDIINSKHEILHTDIKPDNVLVCGVSNRINEMITEVQNNKNLMSLTRKFKPSNSIKSSIKKCVNDLSFATIKKKYAKGKTNVETISDQYINNITTRLSDFGNCRDINYARYDIQTRYYRAPEIMLGYKYNLTCDMWSVGCMIYELLFGEILFDPGKIRRMNRDRNHICDIVSVLGKIPDRLINESRNKDVLYKKNGLLKWVYDIKYVPLYNIINKKMLEKGYSQEDIHLTIDLIYKLLDYDPFKRPIPKTALQHKWFQNITTNPKK